MFSGVYWSVYDKPAYDFPQALYSRLLVGMPIGKAVRKRAPRASRETIQLGWLTRRLPTHWQPYERKLPHKMMERK